MANLFSSRRSGITKLQDLLKPDVDVQIKSSYRGDRQSHEAILQELKDKEIYNIIIDNMEYESMNRLLRTVREHFIRKRFIAHSW